MDDRGEVTAAVPDPEAIQRLLAFEDIEDSGDRVALFVRTGTRAVLRYRELRALVVRAAARLRAAGVAREERVALLLPHTHELVALFFASLYLGAVPSIIAWPTAKMDSEKYRRNLGAVLAGLEAQWLVTDQRTAQTLASSRGAAESHARDVLDKTTIVDSARLTASDPFGRAEGGDLEPTRGSGAPLFIQFSGGTTGTQKSVPIGVGQLAAQLAAYDSVLGLRHDDCVISWLPLYHDMGLVACLLMPFLYRLPVSFFAPMDWVLDPGRFLTAVAEDRATLAWLPNFAFGFMAKKARFAPDARVDLSTLRALVNCSEPIRPEGMDSFALRFAPHGFRASALHSCYAMAETTFAVTQTTPSEPPRRLRVSRDSLARGVIEARDDGERTLVSCGRPLPGMQVRVVDDEGSDSPDKIGEVWLRGSCVMDDYLPTADRPPRWAFHEGWYRTGDLGAVIDGHLYVTGRKKDVVIVGGVNVFPEDIEATVSEIDGIHAGRAVAMGIFDEALGTERLVVVAEVNDDSYLERADELEQAIRTAVVAVCAIAPHQVLLVPPRWIVKSTAGKISRSETRARVLERLGLLNGPHDANT